MILVKKVSIKSNNFLSKIIFIVIVLIIHFFSCSKKDNDILIPPNLYEKITITNFRHGSYFESIYGEILNNTDYVIKRFVFRFELYKYDPNCRLKNIFNRVSETYDLGDFNEFVTRIKIPENLKIFYDTVSKEMDIGSLSEFTNIVNEFETSNKKLVLARKIDIKPNLEPNLSINLNEQIPNSFLNENMIYTFQLQEAYGFKK